MGEGFRAKFLHGFTLVMLVAIVLGGIALAYPSWRRTQELRRTDAELAERIANKEREIQHLRECRSRFKTDPEFVEAIARRNRRVFPGELVFLFED